MANCTFCNKPAGFLSRAHKECAERNSKGNAVITDIFVKSALTGTELDQLWNKVDRAAEYAFLESPSESDKPCLALKGWQAAVQQAADKNIGIDNYELNNLNRYIHFFKLSKSDMEALPEYNIYKLAVAEIAIRKGIFISCDSKPPFVMLKSERLMWLFEESEYHKTIAERKYRGGSVGTSVRVAKGLSVRLGGFEGKSVSRDVIQYVDDGVFGVTDKHLYFKGSQKSFRINLAKIISYEINSGDTALIIMRDTATAKPEYFNLGHHEAKFAKNLLDIIYESDPPEFSGDEICFDDIDLADESIFAFIESA